MKKYELQFELADDEIIKKDSNGYWGIFRWQNYCKDCGWINSRSKNIQQISSHFAVECPKCGRWLSSLSEQLNWQRGIGFCEIINDGHGIKMRSFDDFLAMIDLTPTP